MHPKAPLALIALPILLAGCIGSAGPWDKDAPVLPLQTQEEEAPPPPPRMRRYVELLSNEDGSVGQVEVKTGKITRVLTKAHEVLDFDNPSEVTSKADREVRSFRVSDELLPPAEGRFVLYFENNSTELTGPSTEWLPEIMATLAKRPAPDLRVIGHADRFGDGQHNEELSSRRAEAVRDSIVAAGVEAASLEIVARGESEPEVETADGVREPKNRRVEIVVW